MPSAPGGGIDFTGRVLALKLGALLGQQVVVDNRAGASGILGADTWYGLVAPAATPRPIIGTLNEATLKSLQSPDTRARFLSDGSEPAGSTPEEFQRFMAAEVARWGKVVQSAGLRAE